MAVWNGFRTVWVVRTWEWGSGGCAFRGLVAVAALAVDLWRGRRGRTWRLVRRSRWWRHMHERLDVPFRARREAAL